MAKEISLLVSKKDFRYDKLGITAYTSNEEIMAVQYRQLLIWGQFLQNLFSAKGCYLINNFLRKC